MTGMSRLSRNFDAMRNSRPAARDSIFSSVVSTLGKSTKNGQNRMSIFIEEAVHVFVLDEGLFVKVF